MRTLTTLYYDRNMKSFDTWNNLKKSIEGTPSSHFIHQREVWWCSLGINIGSEQNGVGQNFERPVLVVKKLSSTTFMILPLSTKKKLASFQYELVVNEVIAYVLFDQVKVVDLKRFLRKMYHVEEEIFDLVVEKFKNTF